MEPGLSSPLVAQGGDCLASFTVILASIPDYLLDIIGLITYPDNMAARFCVPFPRRRQPACNHAKEIAMRRRLYFMLPDTYSAKQIADELLLARIEISHIHVLAKDGVALDGLHEASILQKSDFVHGVESGLVIGGAAGIVAGVVALLYPPSGVTLHLVSILITALLGAGIGAWVSSMIASSVPNSRLKQYEQAIADGGILMMVDVPSGRVAEIQQLVTRRHPEVRGSQLDPTIPAFP
jgi:hypothetical protein